MGDFWAVLGFLGIFERIFSGYPLDFIRSKNRPKIRKIRNFWSGIRKIRIHPLVGTPVLVRGADEEDEEDEDNTAAPPEDALEL